METTDRRKFLRQSFLFIGAASLAPRILSSCSQNLYQRIQVVDENCIACGECVNVCEYSSIVLDGLASYSIDTTKCNECKACVPVCTPGAITIPGITYTIEVNNCTTCEKCETACPEKAITITASGTAQSSYAITKSKCVGCGDCIAQCQNEGNALSYVKQYYTVSSSCHGCVEKCSSACSYDAISKSGGKATIDTSKCVKCGKCVSKCGHSAISKAYVSLDSTKCNNCGKCFDACTYSAVTKSASGTTTDIVAIIDQTKCTQCGDCYAVCEEDAIAKSEDVGGVPSIDQSLCTSCGNCLTACSTQLAIVAEYTPASINQSSCMLCKKCITACRYDAIAESKS